MVRPMTSWLLILYIHASGTIGFIGDFGKDKPGCDEAAVSYNANHDTGKQTFVCVQRWVEPLVSPDYKSMPAHATQKLACESGDACFLLGVAAGMGLK